MKKILGLDIGTNSIGFALIEFDTENNSYRIINIGSRIIPMTQDVLGNFDRGNSISQTAERTSFRGIRRLRERHLLRRERLHRILGIMNFLPAHYAESIGWDKANNKTYGKYLTDTEPKLPWRKNEFGKHEFIFKDSFEEMLADFRSCQPHLFTPNENGKAPLLPYNWTLYFLRKKALFKPVTKEELAWIILNFNQKRGYYQLRGEEEEEKSNKSVEYHALKVVEVMADEPQKGKNDIWYNIVLENGWVYRRSSKIPLFDWVGKKKDFIVTTTLDNDGNPKRDKEGFIVRSFRAPSDDDWTLLKKKTESDIIYSGKTVGEYIYDTILQNPSQKVRGKLVRTIERKFYRDELERILDKQTEFHPELQDRKLLEDCVEELYPNNESHSRNLLQKDFRYLFVNDIVFYQRPLKSNKSLIANCAFESHTYLKDGEKKIMPLKCIAKSHPLFQEFRLWQFIQNLRIYERNKEVNGRLQTDVDVTAEFLPTAEAYSDLFKWLNNKKEIKQDVLLKSYFKIRGKTLSYRWNYVEDKEYPCNETHSQIISRLDKCGISVDFLTPEVELSLWHILYSVEDKQELIKALRSFGRKHELDESFVEVFRKFPPFKKEYGAYSEKAIKKLLPLIRMGRHWDEKAIHPETRHRIEKIINGEYDETIRERVRHKAMHLTDVSQFSGLPLWLTSYIVYDRHSEAGNCVKWRSPEDIEHFLRIEFKQHSLRNPIVEQVITETLRTVKDLWAMHGDFSEIHIELGREMKNPADKRRQMTERMTENENTNLRLKSLLMELYNDSTVENVRSYSPGQQEILKIYEEGALNTSSELPDDILKISKMSQPSKSELTRYRLWLEQQYRSPYTGAIIPLSKLFTPAYEIEHIIPQSRYFDNSLSNKVICESEINKLKDNSLGYEFIKKHGGEVVELNFGRTIRVFTPHEYEEFAKKYYSNNRPKMKKLLLDEIPDSFIERQLNDTRYISKVVKRLLSNIVHEEDEQEETSKNVVSCTGGVTSILKRDWGLNDVWNRIIQPRFERLNRLTDTTNFGEWKGNRFQIQMPLEYQKGFSKKRIDHRHHALDALVVACATRSHVNYLNNESARSDKKDIRYELKHKLCYKEKSDDKGNYTWRFNKPWETFAQDAYEALINVIVSFKQNLRVINRTTNQYQVYKDGKKVMVKQTQGDSWAIRKPMHKDTVFGKVSLQKEKTVKLSIALEDWKSIADKDLKNDIRKLITNQGEFNVKQLLKHYKTNDYQLDGRDISKVRVYYFDNDNAATRKSIDTTFNQKTLDSITDSGIRKILSNHLKIKNNDPALAFSPEGLEDMNRNIKALNDGKDHHPIYKVRLFEPIGNKFNVGNTGNKSVKYVVAAKGTNLFFGIYQSKDGKRLYETIPLNIVIDQLKHGDAPVPKTRMNGDEGETLLFWLSPNDLVYVPTEEELINPHLFDIYSMSPQQKDRIYKMVSSSKKDCFFIKASVANPIINKFEFSPLNKMEKSIEGETIKSICWKLKVDRLGNILECKR